jgi:hypothetical protein
MGFLVTAALVVTRVRRTFVMTWLAALGLNLVLFSPLKNQLPDGNTWMLILVAPFIGVFVRQRTSTGGSRLDAWRMQFRRRRLAILSVVALGGVVLAGLSFRGVSGSSSRASASERLTKASENIVQAYDDTPLPDSSALASQLRVSDPEAAYEAIESRMATPKRLGVVGVFTGRGEFRLRALSARHRTLEVIGLDVGARYQIIGPVRPRRAALVANGGFEEGFASGWDISRSDGVEVSETARAHAGAHALQLRYHMRAQGASSGVTQLINRLPQRAVGTRYTLREVVFTKALTRQVVFGFQFLYEDGTSEYVVGRARRAPARSPDVRASGIPAGSTRGWRLASASAVARKRISAIRAFPIDAGRRPLRGLVRVDDVSLKADRGDSSG